MCCAWSHSSRFSRRTGCDAGITTNRFCQTRSTPKCPRPVPRRKSNAVGNISRNSSACIGAGSSRCRHSRQSHSRYIRLTGAKKNRARRFSGFLILSRLSSRTARTSFTSAAIGRSDDSLRRSYLFSNCSFQQGLWICGDLLWIDGDNSTQNG